MKIIKVDNCGNCPHLYVYCNLGFKCGLTEDILCKYDRDYSLEHQRKTWEKDIPKNCPLDDAE